MSADSSPTPALWKPVLLGAMAGGLGWGIRGQYGHETGAMIAGLLVSLTLALLLCPQGPTLAVVRAVAWGTIAIGFGGSMTYGQTVGLTHDAPLVGNWAALGWGMLGLSIKGALWIGFSGALLGMGLGGVVWRPLQVLALFAGLLLLCALGIWVLNEPFDPARKILPVIYFSDSWRWEPDAVLKPRREVWGGYLFAFVGLLGALQWWRRDSLGVRMGLWGALGGAVGFPLGQCLQAYHAWNLESFRTGAWAQMDLLINWWNFMETTFGAVMGATLGLGLASNRGRIRFPTASGLSVVPLWVEGMLLAAHLFLLVTVEFFSVGWVDSIYDFGLLMGVIPVVAVAGGRLWPWLVVLPITLLPIAGKTLRNQAYDEQLIALAPGWTCYVVLPLLLAVALAWHLFRTRPAGSPAGAWLAGLLLLNTWLYFCLNFAFFRFPWPWSAWTARTPNAVIFMVCVVGLTLAAGRRLRRGTQGGC